MAKRREIKVEIPPYLTIGDYKKLKQFEGTDQFHQLIHVISSLTNHPKEEVREWDARSLIQVGKILMEKSNPKQEYHPLIEWNGLLYGYRSITKFSLGEYADLESLAKDPTNNLDQIAALLYRPVKKHKFDSLSFAVKQTIKVINNKIENVFDWYEVEDYNVNQRVIDAHAMKDFPVHLILGAMAFFLTSASQSFNNTLFLSNQVTKSQMEALNRKALRNLLESTGGGSPLSTSSLKPTFYPLQEEPQ